MKRFMMKHFIFTILLAFTLTCFTGCENPISSANINSTDNDDNPQTNTNTNFSKQASQALLVYGDVRLDNASQILIDFPARVQEVFVHNGDVVNKGDTLLTLDYSDYTLEIEQKERLIHSYEIKLEGLDATINSLPSTLTSLQDELAILKGYVQNHNNPQILSLENTLKTQEDQLAFLKETYASNQALFEADALSSYELETSEDAYEKLEQDIASTKNAIFQAETEQKLKISALEAQIKTIKLQSQNADTSTANEIELLKLELESTKAELNQMKAKLNKPYLSENKLIALDDHLMISELSCTNGTYLAGIQSPILKTSDLDTLYVSADIPEESLSQVAVGMAVSILPADDALSTEPITGKIIYLSGEALLKDGDTMVEAKIEITSNKAVLKPGLTVDITITK